MSTKKQIKKFIIVGICAVLIDFVTYKILLNIFSYSLSKALSFLAGACFAYIANKFLTFKKPQHCKKEIAKFSVLYLSTLLANVGVNKLSLMILLTVRSWLELDFLSQSIIVFLSFLAATFVSTVLNFLGQKFWVFKDA